MYMEKKMSRWLHCDSQLHQAISHSTLILMSHYSALFIPGTHIRCHSYKAVIKPCHNGIIFRLQITCLCVEVNCTVKMCNKQGITRLLLGSISVTAEKTCNLEKIPQLGMVAHIPFQQRGGSILSSVQTLPRGILGKGKLCSDLQSHTAPVVEAAGLCIEEP